MSALCARLQSIIGSQLGARLPTASRQMPSHRSAILSKATKPTNRSITAIQNLPHQSLNIGLFTQLAATQVVEGREPTVPQKAADQASLKRLDCG